MITIWNKYKIVFLAILTFILLLGVVKGCENEPKITTKTTINIEHIKDSIKKVLIKELKPIYIDTGSTKYVKIKGKAEIQWRDSIVYRDKPSKTTIKANQYDTQLKSNNATASLKITSTGEVLDVQGTIEYPKQTITNTVTKTSAKSGLFIFAQVPINKNKINAEIGLLYQFKNTLGVMGSLQYNQYSKGIDGKVGLAIKLF